ncbi:MAG: hypothetical protein A3C07_03895 [Candidatus Sungbacteria bacterium RIFCSPHIGHO2_02_FULL_47_11]|uniref:ABM domain-containing protein n=1 Tax=Candidatus Sungbacteria bacterium RIFCSPHIGHO2_02_FULL_47_11 TaxID=1802270 RepID=A0A1G2KH30_9BACT|nr:MAG: hypothetical protein A3C07_03895 [Candidatus Sungbacteria bacterium RIFCSPHIGHO2_02_FULL_47_11]
MPFVVIEGVASRADNKELEQACKEVWESMDKPENDPKSDVGGVMVRSGMPTVEVLVTFIYNNRGDEFHRKLTSALVEKLAPFRLRLWCRVIKTEPDMWFDNPSWAIGPCARTHKPHMES